MKQTAVEWLVGQLKEYDFNINQTDIDYYEIKIPFYALENKINQAKELEKQQQDDFAIEFSEWCLNSLLNGEEPKAETMKELLEIFKNK